LGWIDRGAIKIWIERDVAGFVDRNVGPHLCSSYPDDKGADHFAGSRLPAPRLTARQPPSKTRQAHRPVHVQGRSKLSMRCWSRRITLSMPITLVAVERLQRIVKGDHVSSDCDHIVEPTRIDHRTIVCIIQRIVKISGRDVEGIA